MVQFKHLIDMIEILLNEIYDNRVFFPPKYQLSEVSIYKLANNSIALRNIVINILMHIYIVFINLCFNIEEKNGFAILNIIQNAVFDVKNPGQYDILFYLKTGAIIMRMKSTKQLKRKGINITYLLKVVNHI